MISKKEYSPVFEIWLFWMGVIGSFTFLTAAIGSSVLIYLNLLGKYFLKVLINIYFNNSLNNKQNNELGIWKHRRM